VCMCVAHQRDPINYNSGFQKNWPVSKERAQPFVTRAADANCGDKLCFGEKILLSGARARDNADLFIFIFPEARARLEVRWGVSSLCLCVRALDPAARGLAHWAEKIKSGSLV
jgi:hypothetical protein